MLIIICRLLLCKPVNYSMWAREPNLSKLQGQELWHVIRQQLISLVQQMHCVHARLTQRWEASLWLTGKQLYLGGFESEEDAAHAYDLAALACKGRGVPTNFPASHYRAELAEVASYSQVLAAWLHVTLEGLVTMALCKADWSMTWSVHFSASPACDCGSFCLCCAKLA